MVLCCVWARLFVAVWACTFANTLVLIRNVVRKNISPPSEKIPGVWLRTDRRKWVASSLRSDSIINSNCRSTDHFYLFLSNKIRCDAGIDNDETQCTSCKRAGEKCSFSRIPMKRGPSKRRRGDSVDGSSDGTAASLNFDERMHGHGLMVAHPPPNTLASINPHGNNKSPTMSSGTFFHQVNPMESYERLPSIESLTSSSPSLIPPPISPKNSRASWSSAHRPSMAVLNSSPHIPPSGGIAAANPAPPPAPPNYFSKATREYSMRRSSISSMDSETSGNSLPGSLSPNMAPPGGSHGLPGVGTVAPPLQQNIQGPLFNARSSQYHPLPPAGSGGHHTGPALGQGLGLARPTVHLPNALAGNTNGPTNGNSNENTNGTNLPPLASNISFSHRSYSTGGAIIDEPGWDDRSIDSYYQLIHPSLPILPSSRVKLRTRLLGCSNASLRYAVLSGISGLSKRADGMDNIYDKQQCLGALVSVWNGGTKTLDNPSRTLLCITLILLYLQNNDTHWLGAAVAETQEFISGGCDDLMRRVYLVLLTLDRCHTVSHGGKFLIERHEMTDQEEGVFATKAGAELVRLTECLYNHGDLLKIHLSIESMWDTVPILKAMFHFVNIVKGSGSVIQTRSRNSSSNGRTWMEFRDMTPKSDYIPGRYTSPGQRDQSLSPGSLPEESALPLKDCSSLIQLLESPLVSVSPYISFFFPVLVKTLSRLDTPEGSRQLEYLDHLIYRKFPQYSHVRKLDGLAGLAHAAGVQQRHVL